MTIAITGATGHLGTLVLSALLDAGAPATELIAFARDLTAAQHLADRGVQVRHLDYDDPSTLAPGLDGVDTLLLISSNAMGRRLAQHRAVIDAAAAAGVGRIVYTSAPRADTSINPVAPEHKATEEHLAASGVPHLVLRNGWYNENYLSELDSAAATGAVLNGAGDGRVASASRADYAQAAAIELTGTRTGVITLTGDTAWSFADLAADLGAVLGRDVAVSDVTIEEKKQVLVGAGLDQWLVEFVTGVDAAIAQGELADVNGELSRIIGRPTTPIRTTLAEAHLVS